MVGYLFITLHQQLQDLLESNQSVSGTYTYGSGHKGAAVSLPGFAIKW